MNRILSPRFHTKKICITAVLAIFGVLYLGVELNEEHFKGNFIIYETERSISLKRLSTIRNTTQSMTDLSANTKSHAKFVDLFKERQALSHITFDTIEKDAKALYTVLILISSFVDHRDRRKRIRETWGNSSMWNTADKYKIVFVTGKVKVAQSMIEIAEEAKESRDIISLDIPEDFYLLAKKIIIGLIWAKHNMKFKAILKGDDDTFMNIDNVIDFINNNTITDGYFGQSMAGQPVERNGRYKLTKEEHENDHYDPYCSGGGFIFTNSSVYKIIPIFDLEKILKIDDAHIGEVAFKAGILHNNLIFI